MKLFLLSFQNYANICEQNKKKMTYEVGKKNWQPFGWKERKKEERRKKRRVIDFKMVGTGIVSMDKTKNQWAEILFRHKQKMRQNGTEIKYLDKNGED